MAKCELCGYETDELFNVGVSIHLCKNCIDWQMALLSMCDGGNRKPRTRIRTQRIIPLTKGGRDENL